MQKIRCLFYIILALGTFSSCVNHEEQIEIAHIDGKWKADSLATLNFDINDSQNLKNIIFVVRHNNDYPYNNIRFFASINRDKEKKLKKIDTLNYVLAEPNGHWLGSGFGAPQEILFLYKQNFKFPSNGKYKVVINQAMRQNPLIGIEDIGIKIENVKP